MFFSLTKEEITSFGFQNNKGEEKVTILVPFFNSLLNLSSNFLKAFGVKNKKITSASLISAS